MSSSVEADARAAIDPSVAQLEARRARRARAQRSLWRGLWRALKLLRESWSLRALSAAQPILYATVPIGPRYRLRLCLFNDPRRFFAHLFTQDHPAHHRGMTFALDLPSTPFPDPGEWGAWLEAHHATVAREWADFSGDSLEHPNRARLVGAGRWGLVPLYKGGVCHAEIAEAFPETLAMLEATPHCARGLDGVGQIVFSLLTPGTEIRPHSGSNNLRLRYHLPLRTDPAARLSVYGESRRWEVGRCLCFDDSLEHSVSHRGTQLRVVLMVDLWRPELSATQRALVERLCQTL